MFTSFQSPSSLLQEGGDRCADKSLKTHESLPASPTHSYLILFLYSFFIFTIAINTGMIVQVALILAVSAT